MEEQRPKRSFFVPVLLLLLLFSLTGNMLLASKQVAQKQEDRAQRGLTIINAGNQAKLHIDDVLANVTELLGSGDIAHRLAAKGALGAAFKRADDVQRFISEAEKSNGKPFTFTKRSAGTFLGQIEQSLQQVANHDGPLTGEEQAYLQTVKQVYEQLKSVIAPFDYKTMSKDVGLTVQAGGAWVEMGRKMLDAMNGPDRVVYGGTR